MNKPTDEQIKDELEKLRGLKDKVRRFNLFGDDNRAAVAAQIRVLDERLSEDAVYGDLEFNEHEQLAAIDALNWMDGQNDEAPSIGWLELVQ